jgi:hypothetical protein
MHNKTDACKSARPNKHGHQHQQQQTPNYVLAFLILAQSAAWNTEADSKEACSGQWVQVNSRPGDLTTINRQMLEALN